MLLIIADDLRPELGCYGADYMVTPNIDKLAEAGTLFERAYVQQPVCTASRASFLTGLRPDQTGSDYPYSIYTVEELLEGNRPSIMRHFMNQGYYVRGLGKLHHGYEEHFTEKSVQNWLPQYVDAEMNKMKKKDRVPYECADVPDETYQDGFHTAEAVKTLRRMAKQDKPFFLGLGLWKPHLPWCAPKKYWDLYDRDKIPLSPNPEHPLNSPDYSTDYCNLQKYQLPDSPNNQLVGDPEVARTMKHAYAACVSYMDANVGKMLAELDALGLRENTVVMLISDHGWHLGDQDHWGKSTNFENSTRAPMILSAPGFRPGQRTKALVEYVDVFPSLCEAAGVDVPDYLEGNSVMPLLKDPSRKWKAAAFSQYPRGWPKAKFEGYSIRTDRYHYVQWRELDGSFKDHELYDHKNDPIESVNVVNDPEYKSVVEKLKKQMAAGWKDALPKGIENHSNNPPAPEFVPWGPEAMFGPYAKEKKK
ncbi:MAG: sulfatase [Verrucomicrobiota bacterium]|nr:sulfatase [Verrucomicrobiota bacterium]